jgi:carbamoyltransferase
MTLGGVMDVRPAAVGDTARVGAGGEKMEPRRRVPTGAEPKRRGMRILGLGTEEDSGAALVEDGRIRAAINEERVCRMKLAMGFPHGSIREVLRLSGVEVADLDAILVGGVNDVFSPGLQAFDGWFQHSPSAWGGRFKRFAGRLSGLGGTFPFLERAYYAALWPTFARRRHEIRRILREEYGARCPIRFVDHHFCHVTSAYYTSGFEDALIFSVDGGGDGRSSVVYEARGGRLRQLHETSAFNSLGNYYAYVTHMCGFKAMRHEGKITGLAAHGEPRYVPILREFIDEENGTLVNRGGAVFAEAIRRLRKRLPADWTREDTAASIQRHFEDVVRRYVSHWAAHTGLRNLALAGGVFANVRVNQEVHGLPEVSRVFIHPGMTDCGLPVGAALAACVPGYLDRTMPRDPQPLRDVYLGPDITTAEIDAALSEHRLTPLALDHPLEDEIADLLAAGHVVARAEGRMEYGPRALGNRSILYQPADPAVNDWLNANLRRTEFMPFAPAVLQEERERCFIDTRGAEHAAEFMTITFQCTPWMRRSMAGVVHLDDTARPQLVHRDRNPAYYRIIEAFRERTGLPAIVNTSFNMHEEPIVCSAHDAVRGFIDGNLDYLALGSHLVRHPAGVQHRLVPVAEAPRRAAR